MSDTRACGQCGKNFARNPGVRDRQWAKTKFCSLKCWGLSKRNTPQTVLAEKSCRDERTGCLNWTGGLTRDGYGRFTVGNRPVSAHRAAYEAAFGPIPDGLAVCHRCDNPRCIEPSHLFLGTLAENVADMVEKGRQADGSRINTAKLTPEIVREIRASPLSGRAAARKYGVAPSQIGRIRRRESWPHIL